MARRSDQTILQVNGGTPRRDGALHPQLQSRQMASFASSSAASSSSERQCGCPSRPKPRFGFLRSQRSLDLVGGASKEAEAARSRPQQPQPARRARSAERYEGLRVNDRGTVGLARQTSLQTSMASTDRPPEYQRSPPPSYEAAVGKLNLPPSYEEYLAQRLRQAQLARSSTSHLQQHQQQQQQASQQQQQLCACANCKATGTLLRGGLRVNLPDDPPRNMPEAQQLRVMLPPESSSHDHCPCSKCQSRYGSSYEDQSGNNDMLFSLDTTTAMQGVLTDGIALCSMM